MRFSIIIITFRRDDVLRETLDHMAPLIADRDDTELILVDNNPDDADRSAFLANFIHPLYCKPGLNKGVAGGRNLGIANASGNYLIFLDDDALVYPENFLDRIQLLFAANPKVGILAAKSVNFFTRELELRAFPHTDKSRDPNATFKTFRYIGVCHAIRNEVFQRVGTYLEEFFYGAEEFDLSYRAIDAGYEILYAPELHVLHKRNPSGRLPPTKVVELTYLNKLRVSFMHLPWYYFAANATAWCLYALYLSRGRANVFSVWKRLFVWARANQTLRKPMGNAARAYLRSCRAQIWK